MADFFYCLDFTDLSCCRSWVYVLFRLEFSAPVMRKRRRETAGVNACGDSFASLVVDGDDLWRESPAFPDVRRMTNPQITPLAPGLTHFETRFSGLQTGHMRRGPKLFVRKHLSQYLLVRGLVFVLVGRMSFGLNMRFLPVLAAAFGQRAPLGWTGDSLEPREAANPAFE